MLKNLSGFLVVSLALFCAAPAFADPSVQDIYNAADAGHLGEARQMLDQVLQDHPHSARAHWMAAEIYARGSNFDRARQELSTAEQLAPGLPFVRPEAVAQLQQQLGQQLGKTQATQQSAPVSQAAPHYVHAHPVFPLRTILFVIGAVIVLWLILRPRTPSGGMYSQYPGAAPAAGPMMGPGVGSGIAGGLASGLAVGAGVVAGEELAHHFLDGNRTEGGVAPASDAPAVPDNTDMGGRDFGIQDTSSWGDDSGSVGGDMGGGDDWST
jgi:hypothetical protein